MAPVAKKNKKIPAKIAAKIASKDVEESVENPEEMTVVSGQLEKAIHNKKAARKFKPRRGVVFIRHLPHGFFEDQLKKYFEQFGVVTRVRLARSARTGNSKGFAYIEFAMPEIAQIAAETMDNYLMFRKLVNATYIPPESQRFNYFKTSVRNVQTKLGKSIYVSYATRLARRKVLAINNPSEEKISKQAKSTVKKLNKMKLRFADLGIDFDEYVAKPENMDTSISSAQESPSPKKQTGSSLLSKKNQKAATKSTLPKEIPLKRLLEETIDEEDSSEDDDFQPDESTIKTPAKKAVQQPTKKAQTPKSKEIPLKRLLEETIDEEDSSEDGDFQPDESTIVKPMKKANAIKQIQTPKSKEIALKRLLDETIEDEDSSDDDDFQPDDQSSDNETPKKKPALRQPANKSKAIGKTQNGRNEKSKKQKSKKIPSKSLQSPSDSSFATASSDDKTPPKKPAKKSSKKVNVTQAQDDRLEKIMKRNKQDGKIQKKGKKQQHDKTKSQALQKKIQDTAKMIVKDKKVAHVKGKDLKKKK